MGIESSVSREVEGSQRFRAGGVQHADSGQQKHPNSSIYYALSLTGDLGDLGDLAFAGLGCSMPTGMLGG